MASFYHFKKHEYLSFSKLLNNKKDMESDLLSQFNDLEKKKKHLFT